MLPSCIGAPGAPGACDGSKASPRLPGRPAPGLPPLTVPAGPEDGAAEGLPPLPSFRRNSTSSWNLRSCSLSWRFSYWRVSICPAIEPGLVLDAPEAHHQFGGVLRGGRSAEERDAEGGGEREAGAKAGGHEAAAIRCRREALSDAPIAAKLRRGSLGRLPGPGTPRPCGGEGARSPMRVPFDGREAVTPRRRGRGRSPPGGSATSRRCRCTRPPAAPCRTRRCASGPP